MVRIGSQGFVALSELDAVIRRSREAESDQDEYDEEELRAMEEEAAQGGGGEGGGVGSHAHSARSDVISRPTYDNTVELDRPQADILEFLVEEIGARSYKDYMKEAHYARIERELSEKYGPFKDFILHPYTQRTINAVTSTQWVDPGRVLPMSSAVIIVFMALRGGMKGLHLGLLLALLLGAHPHLVVVAVSFFTLFSSKKAFSLKGASSTSPKPRWPPATPPQGDRSSSSSGGGGRSGVQHDAADGCCVEYHQSWVPADRADGSPGVDYIVLGSDIGSLFTAAVLGRCGHRVLVLERGAVVGQCVMPRTETAAGAGAREAGTVEDNVVIGDHCLHGSAVKELDMLSKVMHPDLAPEWQRVGSAESEYVHSIVSIDGGVPVSWRSGVHAWVSDMVTKGVELELAQLFLAQVKVLMRSFKASLAWKLSNDSSPAAPGAPGVGNEYLTAMHRPVAECLATLRKTDPVFWQLLVANFTAENVSPLDMSYGALVAAVDACMEGKYYPAGGPLQVANALIPAIEGAGGKVLCKAPFEEITVDARTGAATGVRMKGGGLIAAGEGVISGLGAHATWSSFLPKDQAAKHKHPVLSHLSQARPLMVAVVQLQGTAEDLGIVSADVTVTPPVLDSAMQIIPPYQGGLGSSEFGKWIKIAFPSMRTPGGPALTAHTCVMSTPVERDTLKLDVAKREKLTHMTESRFREALVSLFPGTENRITSINFRQMPIEQGVAHTVPSFVVKPREADETPQVHAPPECAAGLTPKTPIDKLFLTGRDLVGMNNLNGSIWGGWLAVHEILGYTAHDVRVLERDALEELHRGRS